MCALYSVNSESASLFLAYIEGEREGEREGGAETFRGGGIAEVTLREGVIEGVTLRGGGTV